VPPLLLEYLREPVQVAIQSLPPSNVDAWPVVVTALATLVGSLGGALISGRAAYKGTKRVYAETEQKSKLEKIYLELFSCRREYLDLLQGVRLVANEADYKDTLSSRLNNSAIDTRNKMNGVLSALHISCPEFDAAVDEFFEEGTKFHLSFGKMILAMPVDKKEASIHAAQAETELGSALGVMQGILTTLAKTLRQAT